MTDEELVRMADEVSRLRALVKHAEYTTCDSYGSVCPWCDAWCDTSTLRTRK